MEFSRNSTPVSRGSFQSRDRTWVFCIAGRFFSIWAPGKPYKTISQSISDSMHSYIHSAVEPQSGVWLFGTPWPAARHAPLSSTISQSLLKFMSIELVTLSNHFILCCPQPFLASGSFQMSWFFASGGQSIGVSASALVLPVNIQDWFYLGLTGLISLQSKGLSTVFSNTTVQKHQFSTQPSLWSNSHIHTWLLEKP